MTVVCAGEAMAAIRAQGPLRLGGATKLSIAGSEANVAIGLSRLGVRSAWVGVVGADELGALVTRTLRAEGVDCSAVRIDPGHPTGLIVFEPAPGARTRALYYRRCSAGAELCPGDIEAAVADLGAVVVSGITPALSESAAAATRVLLTHARRAGVPACLSVNYRAALWSPDAAARAIAELVSLADIVISAAAELPIAVGEPSLDGAPDFDTLARGLLRRGPSEVILTNGAAGASAYHQEQRYDQPAHPIAVKDTIGAGDAFTSGYLSARLVHEPIADSLWQGVASAAFCVATEGDWEGLPTQRDLELFGLAAGDALR